MMQIDLSFVVSDSAVIREDVGRLLSGDDPAVPATPASQVSAPARRFMAKRASQPWDNALTDNHQPGEEKRPQPENAPAG
jgi:hypothetical protein